THASPRVRLVLPHQHVGRVHRVDRDLLEYILWNIRRDPGHSPGRTIVWTAPLSNEDERVRGHGNRTRARRPQHLSGCPNSHHTALGRLESPDLGPYLRCNLVRCRRASVAYVRSTAELSGILSVVRSDYLVSHLCLCYF